MRLQRKGRPVERCMVGTVQVDGSNLDGHTFVDTRITSFLEIFFQIVSFFFLLPGNALPLRLRTSAMTQMMQPNIKSAKHCGTAVCKAPTWTWTSGPELMCGPLRQMGQ